MWPGTCDSGHRRALRADRVLWLRHRASGAVSAHSGVARLSLPGKPPRRHPRRADAWRPLNTATPWPGRQQPTANNQSKRSGCALRVLASTALRCRRFPLAHGLADHPFASPFSWNRTRRGRGRKGALRQVLTRSVLAFGCAPLRLPRLPLQPRPSCAGCGIHGRRERVNGDAAGPCARGNRKPRGARSGSR